MENKKTFTLEQILEFLSKYSDDVQLAMQEYAKIKCKELLEIVVKEVRVRDIQTFEIQDPHDLGCDHRLEVYKDSIMNAVDLENFVIMENKYYTPEIEEFHVGFEYEMKERFLDGTVKNQIDFDNAKWKSCISDSAIMYVERALEGKNAENNLCGIRVKYLDKQDIEDCGFTKECSKYSKILDSSCDVYMSEGMNIILAHYPNLNKISIMTRDYSENIITTKTAWDDKQINLISIKNKAELKRLLKQLDLK